MAAKKKAPAEKKSAVKKVVNKRESISIKVVPDIGPDLPTYYVNYADIGHSANEFSLVAIRVPTRITKEQQEEAAKTGKLVVEPVVQLLFPPALMIGLGEAIAKQIEKFEQAFGKIKRETKNGLKR